MGKGLTVTEYYRGLPPWARGAVSVVFVAGVGLVAYGIYKKIREKSELKDALSITKDADTELKALISKGIKPTLTPSQFESLSLRINQAANGCGTDNQAIFDVFSTLNNTADLLSLISKFGVRYYQPCAATSPISYAIWLTNEKSYGGNLPTFLYYEMSDSEVKKINSILKSKAIDYTF